MIQNVSGLDDVSVISSSFDTGGANKGTISVIGPTRMPYKKVVSLVEYITEILLNIMKMMREEVRPWQKK